MSERESSQEADDGCCGGRSSACSEAETSCTGELGARKLILPAELKVCATCSYWDGDRRVDEELEVVVVQESSHGECLVKEINHDALRPAIVDRDCAWERLAPDETAGAGFAEEERE